MNVVGQLRNFFFLLAADFCLSGQGFQYNNKAEANAVLE